MPDGTLRNYRTGLERLDHMWDAQASWYRDVATGVAAGALTVGIAWMLGAYAAVNMLEAPLRPLQYLGLGFGVGYFGSFIDRTFP